MTQIDPKHRDHLQMAVESTHRCSAKWVKTVAVRERFPEGTLWEGVVAVFEVEHPKAKFCYAWSEVRRHDGDRFVTSLGVPPIDSPVAAVRSVLLRKE